jgi:acid phosphatase family membrane protein YuiD
MPQQILAALSLAELLAAELHLGKNGAGIPSAVSDAIAKLVALFGDTQGFEKPDSAQAILDDLLLAIKAAQAVDPKLGTAIDNIQALLEKSQASMSNLASGQVAQVCTVTMSFNGKSVPVDVFALRQDSTNEVAVDLGLSGE